MESNVVLGDQLLSQAEIRTRAAYAAAGFRTLGVDRGDAIALLLRNDIPFFEVLTAAQHLAAYSVPINWHLSAREVLHVLIDSGAKALVAHADLLHGIRHVVPDELPVIVVATPRLIQEAYAIDASTCPPPSEYPVWTQWLAEYEPLPGNTAGAAMTMMYTSGTTGRPKGVRREPATAEQIARLRSTEPKVMGSRPGMRTVICGPLYHAAPLHFARVAYDTGSLIVLQPRFDGEELLKLIEQHQVSAIFMAPIMFVRLLRLPDAIRTAYDLSSLEHVIHAGAICPPDVKRAMIDWWGPIIHEFYGSTESGVVTHCNSAEWLAHPGTVGRAVGNTTLQIIREDGSEAAANEIGEIYMRRLDYPEFTYHGDPRKRRSIEHNGLITNGDIGYLDHEGYLYLCDRARDMIISGGVNIYPAEIESVLLGFQGVRDCAVLGIPDEEYGEAIIALVEPVAGGGCSEYTLKAHLKEYLAHYKIPRRIEFRNDLPREDSGKIFKRKLRDEYWKDAGRKI